MFLDLLNLVLESQLIVLGLVNVILDTLTKKSKQTCTEITKNKTRLFQSSLKVEVKFLSCKLSKAKNYIESLDMTFLQRLLQFIFSKVFKNSEKNQVFSKNGRTFGFTSIAPRAFKALLRNLSLLKKRVKHMLKSAFYKVVVGTWNSVWSKQQKLILRHVS